MIPCLDVKPEKEADKTLHTHTHKKTLHTCAERLPLAFAGLLAQNRKKIQIKKNGKK